MLDISVLSTVYVSYSILPSIPLTIPILPTLPVPPSLPVPSLPLALAPLSLALAPLSLALAPLSLALAPFCSLSLANDQLAWSPDSRFLAVGGQDDLITLFSPREARVVARCQGHSAFVTSIAFDPGRGEGRGYRFASVGEDGKLILVSLGLERSESERWSESASASEHVNGSEGQLEYGVWRR